MCDAASAAQAQQLVSTYPTGRREVAAEACMWEQRSEARGRINREEEASDQAAQEICKAEVR